MLLGYLRRLFASLFWSRYDALVIIFASHSSVPLQPVFSYLPLLKSPVSILESISWIPRTEYEGEIKKKKMVRNAQVVNWCPGFAPYDLFRTGDWTPVDCTQSLSFLVHSRAWLQSRARSRISLAPVSQLLREKKGTACRSSTDIGLGYRAFQRVRPECISSYNSVFVPCAFWIQRCGQVSVLTCFCLFQVCPNHQVRKNFKDQFNHSDANPSPERSIERLNCLDFTQAGWEKRHPPFCVSMNAFVVLESK